MVMVGMIESDKPTWEYPCNGSRYFIQFYGFPSSEYAYLFLDFTRLIVQILETQQLKMNLMKQKIEFSIVY